VPDTITDIELRHWLRVLRGRWRVIIASVLICAGVASAYAWTRRPIYAAHTQLFISTVGSPSDLAQTYQGGLFAQQRVLSYTSIVSSPPVLQAVINQLGLPETVPALQKDITASVPEGTVLLDVTVEDRSPQRAQAIASALDVQFPHFVNTLETSARNGSSTARTARPGTSSPPGSSVKVSVVSPPRLPTSAVSPRKPLDVGLGVLLGLVIGIAAAVLREYLDRRIRDADDAGEIAGAPLVASIPEYGKARKRPLVVEADPHSAVAESYRQLRTNLQFGNRGRTHRSLVVCSAVPSEGKTLVAANVSLAMAYAGVRVALVDGDLRLPRMAQLFGLDNAVGLADALSGTPVEEVLRAHVKLPLEILTSGTPPTNPSEMLEEFPSVLQALTRRVDIVIVDTPALLPIADASVEARAASGAILVTRVAYTRARQLQAAVQSLRLVGADIVGVVANFVPGRRSYGGRYGRYGDAARRPTEDQREVVADVPTLPSAEIR
jgi:succinoglycan biosynthesis transport protein ExoP